ncbi:hypothetical protein [Paenibacillus sp. YYML68]|uniref:hypothetical protein n=1 Tax=Paenibacillus sp. YYML68 TaxID=2909250 RepID=UPI00248F56EF|nr:hypothetical protein [Paenibacillus sp. YYML68]
MNAYDKKRRAQVVKTLQKAKEQAENALLYLTANERSLEEIADIGLVIEHIENAIEVLELKQ